MIRSILMSISLSLAAYSILSPGLGFGYDSVKRAKALSWAIYLAVVTSCIT